MKDEARDELLGRAAAYLASEKYMDGHPERDCDGEIELRQEMLDEAVMLYVRDGADFAKSQSEFVVINRQYLRQFRNPLTVDEIEAITIDTALVIDTKSNAPHPSAHTLPGL